jgi:hypothetical protein
VRRDQLEHVLHAAAEVAGDPDPVVIGSQAILGSASEYELPDIVTRSIEVDVAFLHDPGGHKWSAVDGNIGEMSAFHQTHGYYAQGVETSTATLPNGWWNRLVVVESARTHPARGLDPHDCVVAKLAAGREKDYEFAAALLDAGIVHGDLLVERIDTMDVSSALRRRMLDWLGQWTR